MRTLAVVLVAFVAGCGGGGSTQVGTSSTPPSDGAPDAGAGPPTPGGGGGGGNGGSGGGGGSGGSGGGAGSGGSGGGGGAGDMGGGSMQVPCSTTPVTIASSPQPGPIAVDASYVYWMDAAKPTTLYRAPRSGGAAQPLSVDMRSTVDYGFFVAVDTDGVYWSSTAFHSGGSAGDSIVYALRPDGHVDALAETAATDGLALSDSTLFFADRYGVYSIPTAGGTMKTLLTQFGQGPVTVDAWNVFAVRQGGLVRFDRGGGAPTTLGNIGGGALAVDFNRVYIVANDALYAVPPSSGERLSPQVIGYTLLYPFVVRDDTTLYFSTPQNELARIHTDGSGYAVIAPLARSAAVVGDTLYYSHDNQISAVCK